ncbi:unnamed protein product [Pleuronectes platessa]|uniref:Uncharacterized protein n=1 Tax=Pleuronectes platessa TaxID=8262 RepID=A0A9N7YAA8_PLEPL|nr:unnamed protein product [Pleuronectes platessa]
MGLNKTQTVQAPLAVLPLQQQQKDLRKGGTDVGTLSESDIANMEDIVQLMSPVKMATTVMCVEEYPTLSVIAPLRAKLLKHLQPCEDDSTLVAEIKRVMASPHATKAPEMLST